MTIRLVLALCVFMFGCNTPSSPSPATEQWQMDEFAIAQERLFAFYGDAAIWEVNVLRFRVVEVKTDGSMNCSGKEAVGCYSSRGHEIQWVTWAPTVLRHEFGHGIAHVLDLDKNGCDWHDWEHREGCQ